MLVTWLEQGTRKKEETEKTGKMKSHAFFFFAMPFFIEN